MRIATLLALTATAGVVFYGFALAGGRSVDNPTQASLIVAGTIAIEVVLFVAFCIVVG